MNEDHRRSSLRDYVVSLYPDVKSENLTHLEVLKSAVELSIQQVRNDPGVQEGKVTETVLDDLQAVFIGNGLSNLTGRGRGKYWYGNQVGIDEGRRGATGYDLKFTDRDDQVQHTIGGIVGSYRYPRFLEEISNRRDRHQHADIRVNKETFKIGNQLSDENIDQLPEMLVEALKPGPYRTPKPKPQRDTSSDTNPFDIDKSNLRRQADLLERNPAGARKMILAARRDPKMFGL